ncbi:MAG TPA: rhomboid family intramembrane serine protease [Thermoanaerobaculia bacterium]|jgi:membrane associated rhomboid family serine protease|nr:rhomboid family intramembrane serine protease [Thermoanaerobaculia bacterium]
MLPIGDDNTGRTITPIVNYLLIAANVAVFVFLQGLGSNERFTYAFSTVPREIVTGRDVAEPITIKDPVSGEVAGTVELEPTPIPVWLTLITSMFMHGGIAHIFGNMLYLWIFGDNLEDSLGHLRYLIFYLTCGIIAGLSHVFATVAFGGNPYLPALGASGAISAVLAGYLVLHPKRRVRVIMMRTIQEVPSIWAIGIWFVFQLVSGLGMFGSGSQAGGVAYAAHIGGFIAGLVLIKVFAAGRPRYQYT